MKLNDKVSIDPEKYINVEFDVFFKEFGELVPLDVLQKAHKELSKKDKK